jgi:hypothetical protein
MNSKDLAAVRPPKPMKETRGSYLPSSSQVPPPPPLPIKKRTDYMFHYSDRYRSGSFDIRDVIRWKRDSGGDHVLRFKDGESLALDWQEFMRFEAEFNKLEDTDVKTNTD